MPETSGGMIEASATRSPSTPRTFRSSDTTAIGRRRAHLRRTRWVKDGLCDSAHIVAKRFFILFKSGLRQYASFDQPRQRRRFRDADTEFNASHERLDIRAVSASALATKSARSAGSGERNRTDPRDCGRKKAGTDRNAMARIRRTIGEPDECRQHMELHVGLAGSGGIDKAAGLQQRSMSAVRSWSACTAACAKQPPKPLSSPNIEIGS